MQSPPENSITTIIHCFAPEFVSLNGIALTQNNEIYGFQGESQAMGSLIQGFWITLITCVVSTLPAILVISKVLPRLGRKRSGK